MFSAFRVIDEEKQIDDSQRCVCVQTDIHTFNYMYGIMLYTHTGNTTLFTYMYLV